ncbi:MAG: N-acetyltransferase, partial [Caldilinea sp. CFX5]|nr:N-acetyltransferase [Caldilinea sp. CFX5]
MTTSAQAQASGGQAAAASDVVVTPVTTAAQKKAFIRFQYEVYRALPHFVPPLEMDRDNVLDPKKNPWFKFGTAQLFLARRGGKDGHIVGRIAAIEDPRYNDFHGTKTGWFGFFECVDDVGVARALFDTAEAWVKARGLSTIMGPASFSSNGEWAFLADGFDKQPAIMMPYNPPYYLALTEACGYAKAKDLWAWEIDVQGGAPEKVARIAEKV